MNQILLPMGYERISLKLRIFWILTAVGYFAFSYLCVQRLAEYLAQGHNFIPLQLPGEGLIPFIPAFFVAYSATYILPLYLFIQIKSRNDFFKMLGVFLILNMVHYLFFILYPVPYIFRPHFEPANDFLKLLFYFYQLDRPYNNFPSLHVSFPFLCFYFSRIFVHKQAPIFFLMSILIAFSTLLIKQHYFLDVAAGWFLAWMTNKLIISRMTFEIQK